MTADYITINGYPSASTFNMSSINTETSKYGIYVTQTTYINIYNSIFENLVKNVDCGGGLFIYNPFVATKYNSVVTFLNVTFSNVLAEYGGGICAEILESNYMYMTVTGLTCSYCIASKNGGGLMYH
jgi:uncharacterized membrane protein